MLYSRHFKVNICHYVPSMRLKTQGGIIESRNVLYLHTLSLSSRLTGDAILTSRGQSRGIAGCQWLGGSPESLLSCQRRLWETWKSQVFSIKFKTCSLLSCCIIAHGSSHGTDTWFSSIRLPSIYKSSAEDSRPIYNVSHAEKWNLMTYRRCNHFILK